MDSGGGKSSHKRQPYSPEALWQALMKRTRPWNRVVNLPRKHESEYVLFGRSCQKAL
jgi:hypothetical protein